MEEAGHEHSYVMVTATERSVLSSQHLLEFLFVLCCINFTDFIPLPFFLSLSTCEMCCWCFFNIHSVVSSIVR